MKKTKRILSILLSCLMLMSLLSVGVYAEGTQDNPINANGKWFGYGVDCYLLNPTLAEGNDGLWYSFIPEQDGILVLEHKYKDVDYDITVDWRGLPFTGGAVDGVIYNGPIMTLPVSVGNPITVHITTKDGAAGTVYANMKIVAGTATDPIKVKSAGLIAYVGVGQTVYFQDDTLNADYATKGLLVEGSVDKTVFYAVSVNSTSGAVTKKEFTDSDGDAAIEATLGGSLGSAGAPPVKPMWAIENNSTNGIGTAYFLTIVDSAHECNWDNDQDVDCNTCGAEREIDLPLELPQITDGGFSVSPDVNGLAIRFDAPVKGLQVDGDKAIYDNATIEGYKLVAMGAIVWNTDASAGDITLDSVNNQNVLNIPADKLCELNEDSASYAVRIVKIPDEQKDTTINFLPYFIFEDESGEEIVQYGMDAYGATYNGVKPV